MAEPVEHEEALRTAAEILIWCFVFSVVLMIFWFCIVVFAGEAVYRLHAFFFDISKDHFALVNYGGLTFAKVGAIGLFLLPYAAIRLVLRKRG